MKIKRYITILFSVIILVAVDIVTKIIATANLKGQPAVTFIDGILEFRYLENRGMAWGLFSGARYIFIALTIIALIVLAYIFVKTPYEKRYRPLLVVLTVLTAGATGNMIDRIFLGYVRDFICTTFIDFPIFNVADIYATCSMIALMIIVLFVYRKDDDFDFLKPVRKNNKED